MTLTVSFHNASAFVLSVSSDVSIPALVSPATASASHMPSNIPCYQTNYHCNSGLLCDKNGARLSLRASVLFRLCSFTSPARTLRVARQGRGNSTEHEAKTPMSVWVPPTIEASSATISARSQSRATATPNTDIAMQHRLIALAFIAILTFFT